MQKREVQIFSKITPALLGCIWGEIFFFFENRILGVLGVRVIGIRRIVSIGGVVYRGIV